jgi:hypothetical protein
MSKIANFLQNIEFQVTVEKLPNVEFFVQKINIPGITMSPVETSTPYNKIYQAGDKLSYSELSLSFIIDENMDSYIEIFNWLTSATAPQSFGQYKGLPKERKSLETDISILVLNSHKNLSLTFNFKNCFPVSLGEVSLDTTQTDIAYPDCTVGFQYDYFTIEKNS